MNKKMEEEEIEPPNSPPIANGLTDAIDKNIQDDAEGVYDAVTVS